MASNPALTGVCVAGMWPTHSVARALASAARPPFAAPTAAAKDGRVAAAIPAQGKRRTAATATRATRASVDRGTI